MWEVFGDSAYLHILEPSWAFPGSIVPVVGLVHRFRFGLGEACTAGRSPQGRSRHGATRGCNWAWYGQPSVPRCVPRTVVRKEVTIEMTARRVYLAFLFPLSWVPGYPLRGGEYSVSCLRLLSPCDPHKAWNGLHAIRLNSLTDRPGRFIKL